MGVPGSAAALLFGQSSEDSGYIIERSLRFNASDTSVLSRTPSSAGNRRTWTWSGWVKRTTLGTEGGIFSTYAGAHPNTALIWETDALKFQDYTNQYHIRLGTSSVFRDPSAWYHIVLAYNSTESTTSDRAKLWVNGVLQTLSGTTVPLNFETDWNKVTEHNIGRHAVYLDGYLADVHFIDGQALAPTDFGEFDEFGVWQPIKFGGTYGTNGFHLDFADNSSNAALGTDTSGNSNTWTVNNLQAFATNWPDYVYAGGATYSSTETGKNFYIGDGSKLFDGTTNSYVGSENVIGGHVYFRPAIAITGVTSLELYGAYNDQVRVNGTLMSHGGFGSGDSWVTVSNPPSSISEISLRGKVASSAAARIKAIRVNGSMLVDPGGSGYDSVVDTPTNGDPADDTGLGGEVVGNYCTLNPLDKNTNASLSNGNLDYSSASKPSGVRGTLAVSSGKWYYEFTPTASPYTSAPTQYFGFSDINASGLPTGSGYIYLTAGFYSITTRGSYKQINGVQTATGWGNYPVGTTMGAALDLDNGTLKIYGGGTLLGTIATGLSGTFAPLVYADTVSSGDTATLNFGQTPFKYNNFGVNRPSADYKCLCTANLPEPTIADSSKYFDTKLYTGSAAARSITMDNSQMSPDFVWLKARDDSGDHHHLFDTVRGAGKRIFSNLTNSESTATTTLSAFGSNGFSLGTQSAVNGLDDPMVAWVWNAGENSNRTYTVKVVNDGGNKYRFDGNGDNAVTLDLAEGSTYTFDQSHISNATHPLRFGTSSNGTNYTTGVTHTGTPGSAGAKTTLVLGSGVSTLYYSCANHSGMGGQINTNSTDGSTVLRGSVTSSLFNQSQTWSSSLTASNGLSGAIYAFDGNFGTRAQSSIGSNRTLTFAPSSGVSFTSTLEVYCDQGNSTPTASWNGNSVSPGQGVWVTVFTGSGTINASYPLVINTQAANQYATLKGVRLDGKLLVDPSVSLPVIPSISSVVKASPEAGFSITKYAGSTSAVTVGHGLNAAPEMIIVKDLTSGAYNWQVAHIGIGADESLILNANNAKADYNAWNNTRPTSTVFSLGAGTLGVNTNGSDLIALCFSSVEGYSSIGSYKGNGSADGPFVFLGFRPAFLLLRDVSQGGGSWIIYDSQRDPSNLTNEALLADTSGAEVTFSVAVLDMLSNGFKLRGSDSWTNTSGYTYIYLAFASNPYKTARAR